MRCRYISIIRHIQKNWIHFRFIHVIYTQYIHILFDPSLYSFTLKCTSYFDVVLLFSSGTRQCLTNSSRGTAVLSFSRNQFLNMPVTTSDDNLSKLRMITTVKKQEKIPKQNSGSFYPLTRVS